MPFCTNISEFVDRDFQEHIALFIRRRHLPGAHVDLQRGQDQARHAKGGVAFVAHAHEVLNLLAGTDVDVQRLLFADGGFPGKFITARRLVVVTDKDACGIGQGQNLLDRLEQRFGRAAGEVAAGGAEVRHEQRVADKGGIADHIGQAGGRMARRVEHVAAHLADVETVALFEQRVELAAVALELGAFVEDLAECVLHHGDTVADTDLAAQLVLQVGRGGEMVGVDVAFEDPFDGQVLGTDVIDDPVGGIGVGAARGVVEVQHAVDDGAGAAVRFADNIGYGESRLVKEGFYKGGHEALRSLRC